MEINWLTPWPSCGLHHFLFLSPPQPLQQVTENIAYIPWRLASWWRSDAVSTIFKTQAFTAAMAFDSVKQRFAAYPYKLADLVQVGRDGLEEALCFLSAPQCCLDSFSLEFRREFSTVDQLTSPLARTLLRALLSVLEGNTFSTERLHSQNARRILSRKMTHELSIHQAALFHTGVGAPAHVASLACEISHESQIDRKRKGPHVEPDACPPQKRRKKGGGGAWRAFVHLQALSANERQRGFQHKNLSQQYAAMDEDMRRRCVELGNVATSLHKRGQRSFPRTPVQIAKENPAHRAQGHLSSPPRLRSS